MRRGTRFNGTFSVRGSRLQSLATHILVGAPLHVSFAGCVLEPDLSSVWNIFRQLSTFSYELNWLRNCVSTSSYCVFTSVCLVCFPFLCVFVCVCGCCSRFHYSICVDVLYISNCHFDSSWIWFYPSTFPISTLLVSLGLLTLVRGSCGGGACLFNCELASWLVLSVTRYGPISASGRWPRWRFHKPL